MDSNSIESQVWHTQQIDKVLNVLSSTTKGLSTDEAKLRLTKYGLNILPRPKKKPVILRFLSHFHNTLIYVLLAAAMVTSVLQHWVDTAVILLVVLINAIIGFIQEGKAEKALDAIRNLLLTNAMVRREGKRFMVTSDQLVPGDIVFLQSGDKVPADLRLFQVKNLQIDEAVLTGESVPIEKNTLVLEQDKPVSDRRCLAYSGTLVTYGQGAGVVVATGRDSEIGHISALLKHIKKPETPLLIQINRFSRWLTASIIVLASLAFAYSALMYDTPLNELFLASVGLAIAAIPEGLPAIVTITLALGVQRMAKYNTIIRRLAAVETLGAVTVICSDKTGTITCNEMTVQTIITSEGLLEVSGSGYDPHGTFSRDGKEIDPGKVTHLDELLQAGMLCNDATLEQVAGQWKLSGDPTEGAIITLGTKAGLNAALLQELWPRTDVIPFESKYQFMATLHHDHEGNGWIYVKGAPEHLLAMCDQYRGVMTDEKIDKAYWEKFIEKLTSRGQRLLAIACKRTEPNHQVLQFSDVKEGLILLGFIGISDPPRVEAIEAVAKCQSAGINVKMITGDHAMTANAIAQNVGIGKQAKKILTGFDLEHLSNEDLQKEILDIDVFARTGPEHKLRLVQALQKRGAIVCMTGDGVNDAPALHQADIGVSMGIKGTEVAKEASEMVLTDDNFSSISHAVEQGRAVYDNIIKSILFILPTNGGEAFTILLAMVLGLSLPISPVQILWINMITAITLALSLAFELPEEDVMCRPVRKPNTPLFSAFLIWRIIFVSLILVAGTFGLFLWTLNYSDNIDYARTVAVNTLVMFEIFYLLTTRYISSNVLSIKGLLGNRYVLLAIVLVIFFQLLFTYTTPMQIMFSTTSIGIQDWLMIITVSFSVFVLVEIEKYLFKAKSI